jgi:hypothetical protein
MILTACGLKFDVFSGFVQCIETSLLDHSLAMEKPWDVFNEVDKK